MREIKVSKTFEIVVDKLGEFIAFFTVALIAFLYINDFFKLIPNADIVNILKTIREFAILAVVALAGLEFVITKGFLLFLIYAGLVAVAVIFMFFPGVLPHTQAVVMNLI